MKIFSILLLIVLMISCHPNKFNGIIITETAINLGDLNSEYDDYNSELPFTAGRMDIYFSSNRFSKGSEFDIVDGILDFTYLSEDNILGVHIPNAFPNIFNLIISKINSENDEFGPYTYYLGKDLLFLYATNPQDTFKINVVEHTNWNYPGIQAVSDPIPVSQLNDHGDNLYPTIDSKNKKLYFCSNRFDSCFSIYSALYNTDIIKESLVNGDIKEIIKENSLSSSFDDKCPYIKDNFMVFTSNRDGNYDLWYSKLKDKIWTKPKKFDIKINTSFNEYRPVIFKIFGFDLMIFSSDRPNGKGGYDLYIVKIDEYIN